MNQIECIVTGRVQRVMYRDFCQRKARGLWITGTVQNLENGTVRVVAQGSEEKLQRYITYLRKGSFLAKVQNVSVRWLEPTEQFKDFVIVY